VIEKSPGEKAGFRTNDEIISVGNNVSHNIQQYKNAFQAPNENIKVVVRRNNELLILNIKTKSIL
jgi:predicted metalloprotease with PDZ domain